MTALWTCSEIVSSVAEVAKTRFETAWSTVTGPTTMAACPLPPRSILQNRERHKLSKAHRTTFTLPPGPMGKAGSAGQADGDQNPASPQLSRRSMPVMPAVSDAVVAEAAWRRPSPEQETVDSWYNHPTANSHRHTVEGHMHIPVVSGGAWSQSPLSAEHKSPGSPSVGAPPGPPSAVDFEDWWTPDMVRERSQRPCKENSKNTLCQER